MSSPNVAPGVRSGVSSAIRGGLVGDLCRETEGVTGGVEHHPPQRGGGLERGDTGAEHDRGLLGPLQVLYGEVEVDVLGTRPVGPGRRTEVRDAHGTEPEVVGLDRDEVVTGERDLAVDELRQAQGALDHPELPAELTAARSHVEELVGLGELAGDLLEGFLQVGTLDIRHIRKMRLGMGIAKLLERSRKKRS